MLQKLIAAELFDVFLVFTRIGAAMIIMPGFGASYVKETMRLALAIMISILVAPVLSGQFPSLPNDSSELFIILFKEVTFGVFLGFNMILLMVALEIASESIGMSVGFRNANALDPTFSNQSSLINIMMNLAAICIIFISGVHHLMIAAIVESYSLFPVSGALFFEDFAKLLLGQIDKSFHVGFQLASPFIVFSIILYSGLGMVSRLMPQLQIFFLSLPLQIYLGCSLFTITVSAIMMWFIKHYEDGVVAFLAPI